MSFPIKIIVSKFHYNINLVLAEAIQVVLEEIKPIEKAILVEEAKNPEEIKPIEEVKSLEVSKPLEITQPLKDLEAINKKEEIIVPKSINLLNKSIVNRNFEVANN